jgi:phenylpropionate dioxygenase-like ring-hydroxylating dioxygenase large terminal subunit
MLADLTPSSVAKSTPEPNDLPVGGVDANRFNVREAWYPVFYVEDLDKTKPAKFTLLEQDLVIWWDPQSNCWRAFADQCPHRLAPLSEGRITQEGRLECPYHGWTFTGDGSCEQIPQQPAAGTAHQSPRACVPALPAAECQGLLFVYPGQPERAAQVPIPVLPALTEDAAEWVCLNTFRDLPYDALTLLENVLDSSHVPFTHHGSVGNRANASPVELELREFSNQGFTGFWADGPRKGTLGSQTTQFVAPGLMWHDLTSKKFGRTITAVYATPIRKGECRLFARFPFKFGSKFPSTILKLTPQWYSHLGQNSILEDDQIFLHYQERYLAAKGGSSEFVRAFYLPTRADTFVTALRKWVNEYGAEPFPNQPLPPAQTVAALLNRYDSHTQHCRSCRGALKNIQRLRKSLLLTGALAWLSLPVLGIFPVSLGMKVVMMIIAGLSASGWWGLGQLERRFYQGRAIPPRNFPEKPVKQ